MVMELAGRHMQTVDGLSMEPGYVPEVFPSQQKMQALALGTKNLSLQRALLDFQYPFRVEDLMNSGFSKEIKQAVLQAASR
jgi:hypothetical protein